MSVLTGMACRDLLRKGGPQTISCAAVLMMPQLNGNGALDLFTRNYVFKAGFWAWLLAQTLKAPLRVSCPTLNPQALYPSL
jgi:hypothetical protein